MALRESNEEQPEKGSGGSGYENKLNSQDLTHGDATDDAIYNTRNRAAREQDGWNQAVRQFKSEGSGGSANKGAGQSAGNRWGPGGSANVAGTGAGVGGARQNLANRESGVYDKPGNEKADGKPGKPPIPGIGGTGIADASKTPAALKAMEGIGEQAGKKTEEPRQFAKDAAAVGTALGGGNGFKAALAGIRALRKHRKGGGILVGIVVFFITIIIVAVSLFSLPLKLLSFTMNLQDTFFASAEDAANRLDDNLIQHYMIKMVAPGLTGGRCTTTRADKSCAVVNNDNNMVMKMYRAWRDSNLEGKLARDHGIEMRRVGNKLYLRYPGLAEEINLGQYEGNVRNFEDKAYGEFNRRQFNVHLNLAMDQVTNRKHNFFRHKVMKLGNYKYGSRNCGIIKPLCAVSDGTRDIKDRIEDRKNAWKIRWSEKVLMPHSEAMHLAYECAQSGFKCTELGQANSNGERLAPYDTELRAKFQALRSTHGEKKLEELNKDADEIKKNGYANFIIKKIAGETIAKGLSKAIPIFGQAEAASSAVTMADKAGPAIRYMNQVRLSSAFASTFIMMRAAADDIKTGNPDPEMLGSFTAGALDAQPGTDQGGAPVEASPYYRESISKPDALGTAASFSLSPIAHAAEATPTCNDGKPYPSGALVCEEVTFKAESPTSQSANVISDVDKYLNLVGTYTSSAFQTVLSLLIDVLMKTTPGGIALQFFIDKFTEVFKDNLEPILTYLRDVANKIIFINPFSENQSATRTGEIAAAGADTLAQDAAGIGQGGAALTSYEVDVIRSYVGERRKERFEALPLRDKLFSTDESESFISRLALAMPTSDGSVAGQFGSILTGFGRMTFNGFAMLVAPQRVSAQVTFPESASYERQRGRRINPDPFGIVQLGYKTNDPVFTNRNPVQDVKDRNCENTEDPDNRKAWGDKFTYIEEYTKKPIPRETNACMLYRDRVQAMGVDFDESLRETRFDLATGTGSSACGGHVGPGGTLPAMIADLPFADLDSHLLVQGAYQDQTTCEWYVNQADPDGGEQTTLINRFDASGKYVSTMAAKDAGHGTSIALENIGGVTHIWLNFKDKVRSFPYSPGTITSGDQRIKDYPVLEDGNGVAVSIFNGGDLIATRNVKNGGNRYTVRKLSDVKNNVDKVLGVVGPVDYGVGPFQGFAVGPTEVYQVSGATDDKAEVRAYNWQTGKRSTTFDITDLGYLPDEKDAPGHEPEGAQVMDDGALVVGIKVYKGQDKKRIREWQLTPATNPSGANGGWKFPLITTQQAIKAFRPGPWCYDSQTNCHHTYPAADIMIDQGTTVVAAVGGYILTKKNADIPCTGELGGYPTIQIKGDDGNYYFYAHFQPGSLTPKTPGNKKPDNYVAAGEVLGKVGWARCGQGSTHLHLQMYNSVINGNGQATNIQPQLVKAFNVLPAGGSPL